MKNRMCTRVAMLIALVTPLLIVAAGTAAPVRVMNRMVRKRTVTRRSR